MNTKNTKGTKKIDNLIMQLDYAEDLRTTVTTIAGSLAAISDSDAGRRPAPGKWSAKEIIGHLIDSAANNHARFVRAQLQDDLVFPGYAQAEWVAIQRYQEASWQALLMLWREYNLHIARVMEAVPTDVRLLERARHNLHEIGWTTIPLGQPATLDHLMRDYVGHLHHHLNQIQDVLGARR
jgi:DinB superfamily